jgi:hypothetical protein
MKKEAIFKILEGHKNERGIVNWKKFNHKN